jgi:hypothetical protein
MSKSDSKIKRRNIVKEDRTSERESTAASPTLLSIETFQLCGTFTELYSATGLSHHGKLLSISPRGCPLLKLK